MINVKIYIVMEFLILNCKIIGTIVRDRGLNELPEIKEDEILVDKQQQPSETYILTRF